MMAVKFEARSKRRKGDTINLLILICAVSLLGVYLIATTVLIAKDGVTYIEYAKKFAVGPAKAMRDVSSAPGYSFLICSTNKLINLFYEESSLKSWIISAQVVSLAGKVIATVALYFVGSLLVGRRMSFWAILILTILPIPAEYGSDALTEWTYIMLLAIGFWLLLLGARFSKWWIFGCVGLIAGLGYLIRPECCQLVIYGTAWLLFNLIRPQNKMYRVKATGALILLLAGFAVIAVPYMRFMGYVFPEQSIGRFVLFERVTEYDFGSANLLCEYSAALIPAKIIGGFGKFANNICEILMYYFVPFFLIGIYSRFKRYNITSAERFFIPILVLLNTGVLIWLYCKAGFMSKRHTLPLVSLTIFYVPIGLQVISDLLAGGTSSNGNKTNTEKVQFWFFVLSAVGMVICMPKLFRPIRIEKQGYREAAKWLRENTTAADIIAVPDARISFYAERETLDYESGNVAEGADYVVSFMESESEEPEYDKAARKEYSVWVDERKKRKKIVIYRVID